MLAQMPIYFDARWAGSHGIGRFASEVQARLPGIVPLRILGTKLSPFDPLAISLALASRKTGCYLSPGFNPPLRSPIPFAFTIHDLIHLQVPQESSALRRTYYAAVVRPATRRAMRILTVSESSRHDILEWSGLDESAVVSVGNGVSPAFHPAPTRHEGPPYFLHVGRRVGHKNIPRLLAAFAASRACADARLVFTGAADANTVDCSRAMGVGGKIMFAGDIDDKRLAELYRNALALVFPSLQEGFGLPVVEAMACGTPVIASNIRSLREITGLGNACLVDPLDTDAIAGAMDAIYENSDERARLSASGLARSRNFRWSEVAARVEAALRH